MGGVIGYNPKRGPPKDNSIKVWSQLQSSFRGKDFKHFTHEFYVKTLLADVGSLGWWAGSSHWIHFFPIRSYVKTMWPMATILVGGWSDRIYSQKGTTKGPFHQGLVLLTRQFHRRRFLNIFPIWSYVKTMSTESAVLVGGGIIRYNSERVPPKEYSNKVWSQLAKQFQRRRILNIFPIGFYVKTMSAVLVGSLIQFWKGSPKDHSIQSLVPIGQAVSQEKILIGMAK